MRTQMLNPGARLGPYEIVVLVGSGGMGEVYRARDTRLERAVAIKVLPESVARDSERLLRFEHEARLLSTLDHPNLLAIYDVGEQQGVHYLVSEFLEGQTLAERIGGRPMSQRRTIHYALQIASGLSAAHDKSIVHRDLKPDNIFITRDDRVKILDFGLAKQTQTAAAAAEGATMTGPTPTIAGVVMGTAGYMSPEQVRAQPVDRRSDIFSFGAILYEMVSGRRAFQGESGVETMNAIVKDEPPELSDSELHVNPGLDRILRRCLEKLPERRFQSASDLGFAIEALSVTSSSTAVAKSVAAKSRLGKKMTWLTAALVLVVAGIAFLAGLKVAHQPQPVFQQIAAGPGYVSNARFTPDGASILYGAAWNGKPIEIFSARPDGLESRKMGLPPADILATSSNGEMAILLDRHHYFQWMTVGTLALAPLSGGAARPLLENVTDADISSDGKTLAVARLDNDEQVLEFPIGKTLYRTSGWIDHPEISPDGKEVAFLEHPLPGDDRGLVTLIDASGKVRRLTREWFSVKGLVWSRKTDELWFSSSLGGEAVALRAVSRDGKVRVVLTAPIDLLICDINSRGQALLLATRTGSEIAIRRPGQKADEVVDYASSMGSLEGLSADGSLIPLEYAGEGSGTNYLSYVVKADTSELIRLGEGDPAGISPDGKWVVSFMPSTPGKVVIYPTGPGEARHLDIGNIQGAGPFGTWTRDNSKFAFTGTEAGKAPRVYLLDINTGQAHAVTPEGTSDAVISPDGRFVVARSKQGFMLYPVAGGTPQPVNGMAPQEVAIGWDESGTRLYVWTRTLPARVSLLDPQTGKRQLALQTMPPDPAGLLFANLFITPDGHSYVYRYRRFLSSLNLADGLH